MKRSRGLGRRRADADAMEALLAAFAAFLATRGLRLTPERREIVRQVAASTGHFGPDDLVAQLGRGLARASRATVYRTLDLMREAGLVGRVELGPLGVRYERDFGRAHHDHLACVACGRIFEFVSDEIERLQAEACARHDFVALRHMHRIMGLCRPCRDAGRTDPGRRRSPRR